MIIDGIPYLQTSSETVPDLTTAKIDFLIIADLILSKGPQIVIIKKYE